MNYPRARLLAALLLLPLAARAQLQWKVFDETSATPAANVTAANGLTLTVPAGKTYTLYATNFLPVDFSAPVAAEVYVTINFKASGGLSSLSSGTRAIGFGLYNNNATDPGTSFADDKGYFTWLNGRNTGSLIELRRRNGDGTAGSLLNQPTLTSSSYTSLGTGTTTQTTGVLSDSNTYALQLHLQARNPGVSLGNTSSTTSGAGVWLSGPGLSQTAYTNPDNPPATLVFNEVGFLYYNSTTAPVTLTISSLTGLTPINSPGVATQPAAISLNPGQSGTLSVAATGTAPLTYQWQKNGANVAGATGASYTIPNASTSDGGSYTVAITNAYGTATSNAATVTVTSSPIAPVITAQPTALTVSAGQSASFAVAGYGSSPLTYQWQKNGAAISGATLATLNLTNVGAGDAASYAVVLTNSAGTVTSAAATLSVNTAPTIATQPTSVSTALGQNVTFSVAATGSPAPTYQWLFNGVNIAGATNPTLTISNVAIANAGVYTVNIVNSVGAVLSSSAGLFIPSPMAVTALAPSQGQTGLNTDSLLRITFDRPPAPGKIGRINLVHAGDNKVVDTIDMAVQPYTRTIGTQTVNYIFYPILVTGNTATIFPHAGVLAYGQSYYVTIDPGVIADATGATFTGISDPSAFTFSTKAAGPAAGANFLTVNADGTGDFSTVQGAIDFVPSGNTQKVTIFVKKGTYTEMNYIGSQKPFITVQGEDRAATVIQYADNNNFNTLTGNNRAMFSCDANDFTLQTITLHNLTPVGGSQAEAYRGNGLRQLFNRVNFASFQDTFLINGNNCTAFVTDCYIEGDVDYMWGSGAVYFQRCELKALNPGYYTQIRNGATQYGNVYVDCVLDSAPGVTGSYLGRIDPTPGNFPYSNVVYLNCAMGPHIVPAGWLLNNATTAPNVQWYEYQSTDLNGATLNVSQRISSSRQLSANEAAIWRNPSVILQGWVPQVATTFEASPQSQTATLGSNVTFTVVANGAPEAALQWYKNGAAIAGATSAALTLPNVQGSDAATYTVTATNLGNSITSSPAVLTLGHGAFAGSYFGTVSGGGNFALFVRDNSTGVFLAAGTAGGAQISRAVSLDANGNFSFTTAGASGVAVKGKIASGGAVSGTDGTATLTGSLAASGSTGAYAGSFQTGASGGSAIINLITGAGGQAFVLVQNGSLLDGGSGTVSSSGAIATTTSSGLAISGSVAGSGASASLSYNPSGGAAVTAAGTNDAGTVASRFREFSARAQIGPGAPLSVGFIVAGNAPDTVLIRGIGPTLADVFSLPTALTNPRVDLFGGGALFASNIGWISALNASAIALADTQVGAFPLREPYADSAVLVTLPSGSYSAQMSSAGNGTNGIGLVEVYDVSSGAAGQRLTNFSVGGIAGAGANTLTAGLVVSGAQPKRMLIRAIGPGLSVYGITGTLPAPVLSVYNGSTQVGTNTGWTTSLNAGGITAAASEVGAVPLAASGTDSALLINLAPGAYTAQATNVAGASGAAIIEFYELP